MMKSNTQIWQSPNEVRKLFKKVEPYTYLVESKLSTLIRLGEYLSKESIPGDFVECGVYRGGSAAVLSRCLGSRRHLWLYDSFQGLPETSTKDGEVAKEWIGKCLASVEEVREVMAAVSTGPEDYTISKGWFRDTFKDTLPSQVALLHCDSDWYESVSLVLETFYPLVPDGGCVILDDFGFWEGCREAFYEFCHRHSEKPLLERVERDQAFWIKGRASNRILIPNLLDTHERESLEKQQIYFYSEETTKAQQVTATVRQEITELRQQMEAEKSLRAELESAHAQTITTLQQKLQELEATHAQTIATLQQKLQEQEIAYREHILSLEGQLEREHSARAENDANRHRAESLAQDLRARIAAMESSKFWKLRRMWFRLKGAVGFARE